LEIVRDVWSKSVRAVSPNNSSIFASDVLLLAARLSSVAI
jgi:hypothetical protein